MSNNFQHSNMKILFLPSSFSGSDIWGSVMKPDDEESLVAPTTFNTIVTEIWKQFLLILVGIVERNIKRIWPRSCFIVDHQLEQWIFYSYILYHHDHCSCQCCQYCLQHCWHHPHPQSWEILDRKLNVKSSVGQEHVCLGCKYSEYIIHS